MSPLPIIALLLMQSLAPGCYASAFVWTGPRPPILSTDRRLTSRISAVPSSDISGGHEAPAFATSPKRPIVVIGAGGKTGRIITRILAGQSMHVCAVTRSGRSDPKDLPSEHVTHAVGDVTKYDTIERILEGGAAGVIFAATSSGKRSGGGDVVDVDYEGAYIVARACIAHRIPKFVLLSAGCVTRPNALGTRLVNKLTELSKWYGDCDWMDAKVAGEAIVRDLYQTAPANANVAYSIVRTAAALSDKLPVNADELLVLQGDVYSSAEPISRENVAHMVIATLLKGKSTDSTTIEVCPAKRLYKNDEANFLDVLSLPWITQTKTLDLPPELVHGTSQSYSTLLDNLVVDKDMQKFYGSIISTYRGEGIRHVQEFSCVGPASA